jgi:hypothetical protein
LSNQPPCSVCGDRSKALGLCNKHYQRLRNTGSPTGSLPRRTSKAMEWIRSHVGYKSDDCLRWPFSATDGNGRGQIRVAGQTIRATRVMCELAHGAPPAPGLLAIHSCGKGHEGCTNPCHLRWGTHAENNQDTVLHGTANLGERCPKAKLTREDVRAIRQLKSRKLQREIAKEFGIGTQQVSRILTGRDWSWLA